MKKYDIPNGITWDEETPMAVYPAEMPPIVESLCPGCYDVNVGEEPCGSTNPHCGYWQWENGQKSNAQQINPAKSKGKGVRR